MKKAFASLLCLLVLLASSKVVYAQHLCGGQEVDSQVTVGHVDFSCGMPMESEGCCEDELHYIDIDDNYSFHKFEFEISQDFDFTNGQILVEQLFFEYTFRSISFAEYSPPALERDLQVLYETFLI